MMDFLAVLATVALFVVCLVVTLGWLAVRRIRRSRPVVRGARAVAAGTDHAGLLRIADDERATATIGVDIEGLPRLDA